MTQHFADTDKRLRAASREHRHRRHVLVTRGDRMRPRERHRVVVRWLAARTALEVARLEWLTARRAGAARGGEA